MKLPGDGPKRGPKNVAVVKCKQFDWFIFIVVLTTRIPQIMIHNRVQRRTTLPFYCLRYVLFMPRIVG
jgi:hypothetical protein